MHAWLLIADTGSMLALLRIKTHKKTGGYQLPGAFEACLDHVDLHQQTKAVFSLTLVYTGLPQAGD